MEKRAPKQESFNSRNYFILAAIGSAVGLGNIWRFPYVAYSNGGGAFILPYLIALLSAGIPLLFFDYAIGHRYRGSAPLALRRLGSAGAAAAREMDGDTRLVAGNGVLRHRPLLRGGRGVGRDVHHL